jgi:hypothetical protein
MAEGCNILTYITPKLTGCLFISVYSQMDMKPAVGWQVPALNGLLYH